MSLLGIDIGTSGCKSAVYSEKGECFLTAYSIYRPLIPSAGLCEFDSQEVLTAILDTIARSANAAEVAGEPVTALSAGSFSEAVVPVGLDGSILGNSIAGSDNRNAESVKPFLEMGASDFYRINPNILSFTYTFPKLAWYRDNIPELYNKTWKFLNWSDFIAFYLTGKAGTAFSHANRTLLFDLWKEDWSDVLLERGGIDRGKLAEPVMGSTIIGTVKTEIASGLGLGPDVKVVAGGHDQCMNAVGAGAIAGGQSVTGIGTFECSTLVFDSVPDTELLLSMNLSIEHHVVPGKYVTLIYNQAGSLLDWFIKVFARDLRLNGLSETEVFKTLEAESGSGPSGLIFLPMLEPSGAPYFKTGMTGTFHGLNASTSRGDMYKALLEGESMYFLETFEQLSVNNLHVNDIIATGGGSKSELWLQIKANLLQQEIKRAGHTESGTLGGCMLAGVGTGVYSGFEEAVKIFKKDDKVFSPEPENSKLYRSFVEKYKEMFEHYA